jgi:hypothetical protein
MSRVDTKFRDTKFREILHQELVSYFAKLSIYFAKEKWKLLAKFREIKKVRNFAQFNLLIIQ